MVFGLQSPPAQGIPEPSLVFYGKITLRASLVEQGEIQFVLNRVGGGQSINISVPLAKYSSLDAQGNFFSYRVKIPVESLLPGMTITPQTIPLTDNGTLYARTVVITALGGSMTFQEASTLGSTARRGIANRLDFDVTGIDGKIYPADLIPVVLGKKPPQYVMDLNADQAIDAADLLRSAADQIPLLALDIARHRNPPPLK